MPLFIPLLLLGGGAAGGAAAYHFITDDANKQEKELYEIYAREIGRGNFNIAYSPEENMVVDFKNREVYFIDSTFMDDIVVKAHIDPLTMRAAQRPHWDLDPRDWGRSDDYDNKTPPSDQMADVYWKGLFNLGKDHDDPRESLGTTIGSLNRAIDATVRSFEKKQNEVKERQEEEFNKMMSTVSNLSEEQLSLFTAHMPAEAELDKLLGEFRSLTGIDTDRYDKQQAFIAVYSSLKSSLNDPILTSNTSTDFQNILGNFHATVRDAKLSGKPLAATVEKLEKEAPALMAGKAPELPDAPETDDLINKLPFGLGKYVKEYPRLSLGIACLFGAGLAGMIAPLVPGAAGIVTSTAAQSLLPLLGIGILTYAGYETFFKGSGQGSGSLAALDSSQMPSNPAITEIDVTPTLEKSTQQMVTLNTDAAQKQLAGKPEKAVTVADNQARNAPLPAMVPDGSPTIAHS